MNAPARKSYASDPAFEAWKDRALKADMRTIAEALGFKLPRAGEFEGPCPACGGDDRFSIAPKKNVFNCRKCGGGRDAVALVMKTKGLEFVPACEWVLNEPPPERGSTLPPRDADADRERVEDRRQAKIEEGRAEIKERSEAIIAATAMFEAGEPFADSYAEAYMERRGIRVTPSQAIDLRFASSLPYWGFPEGQSDERVELGVFPAMLAAIRNARGDIQGVHRTFLDPDRPRKLTPPGNRKKNRAKMVYRHAKGGVIWLGPVSETVVIAEGIETVLSWIALPDLPSWVPPDITPITGVSLGNIAGKWLTEWKNDRDETVYAPKHPRTGDAMCSGRPDFDEPGIILPEQVKQVVILGDGDSDVFHTRAQVLCGARRFQAQGKEVHVQFAPEGMDFNVVLVELMKEAQR